MVKTKQLQLLGLLLAAAGPAAAAAAVPAAAAAGGAAGAGASRCLLNRQETSSKVHLQCPQCSSTTKSSRVVAKQ